MRGHCDRYGQVPLLSVDTVFWDGVDGSELKRILKLDAASASTSLSFDNSPDRQTRTLRYHLRRLANSWLSAPSGVPKILLTKVRKYML